jgi:hypothetical protein
MNLVRLIYTSTQSDSFESNDIEDILVTARNHNDRNAITGVLTFNQKYFLQCLEGSSSKVNKTYQRILSDTRHTAPALLSFQEVKYRCFSQWNMAYVPGSSISRDLNLRYSDSGAFEPYTLTSDGALMLLQDLVATLPKA